MKKNETEKRLVQKELVLKYLKKHKYITSLKAMNELSIIQLPRRIFDLREDGYDIERQMVVGKNARGETVRFAKYYLKGGKE